MDPPESYGESAPPLKKRNRRIPVILSVLAIIAFAVTGIIWTTGPNPTGHWTNIDYVRSIEHFDPQPPTKGWIFDHPLMELTVFPDGKTDQPSWTWRNRHFHYSDLDRNSKFFIKNIQGEDYLFLEWQGNETDQGLPSVYFVYKKGGWSVARTSQQKPIEFEQDLNTLTAGDSIVLDQIFSSSPYFAKGDTVTVKGRCTLSNQPEATLLLTTTATQGSGHSETTKEQRITVSRGSGTFILTYTIPYNGCSHLAFYDKTTGQSLGGLYFGTKEQIEEIKVPNPTGHWKSVDFVSSIEQFDPEAKSWRGDLDLKELTFLPDGKTDRLFWTWKNDILHHSGDNTDAKFLIKRIAGSEYLFLQWMSSDVIRRGLPPKYYVLKKEDSNAQKGTP